MKAYKTGKGSELTISHSHCKTNRLQDNIYATASVENESDREFAEYLRVVAVAARYCEITP